MKKITKLLLTLTFLWAFPVLYAPGMNVDAEKAYREHLQRQYDTEMDNFIAALAERESGGVYDVVNRIGAMGLYQFTEPTLKVIGMPVTVTAFTINPDIFPPEMQKEALLALFKLNETILNDFILHYQGMVLNGILITKGGILAGAHLGGAGGVKAWLCSGGIVDKSDGHTKISDYMREFSRYRLYQNLSQ